VQGGIEKANALIQESPEQWRIWQASASFWKDQIY
jgi:hypothetical protein